MSHIPTPGEGASSLLGWEHMTMARSKGRPSHDHRVMLDFGFSSLLGPHPGTIREWPDYWASLDLTLQETLALTVSSSGHHVLLCIWANCCF